MSPPITLKEALFDVKISSLQLEFAIRLLSCCERELINVAEFNTNHAVLLEHGVIEFPASNFTTMEDIVHAASVTVSAAFGTSTLTLDKAWEVAGVNPNPNSKDEIVKLRTLVYMIRCAYAHGIADPRWKANGSYRRILQVTLRRNQLQFDFSALDGKRFDFSILGGHTKWFEILDESVTTISTGTLGVHSSGK